MSDSKSAETPAPAQLNDHDLEDVAGGLIIVVAPAPATVSSQPIALPAVQRTLIGL